MGTGGVGISLQASRAECCRQMEEEAQVFWVTMKLALLEDQTSVDAGGEGRRKGKRREGVCIDGTRDLFLSPGIFH